MASIFASNIPNIRWLNGEPISTNLKLHPTSLSFPRCDSNARLCAVKTGSGGGGAVRNSRDPPSNGAELLRKPAASSPSAAEESESKARESERWVDWEDQILGHTVPLVGFVRMILHSGKYESGDRLDPEHERTILERLLPYHPECEKKIGCGVAYITIGYHPDFESSRCLFIVRKDGELVDFSFWKCIKGMIRKNYPLYADSFILRHFRRRRHSD
ncbi:protein DCL, chloroplastic-like [Andrographis paniculata]|uniref:protein DCL, chloroplastic-like n=1 Tax=Andrographis paniculata TaxID=175694 RepID=UPI0021E87D3A|nr:protein DCL, chloroplastic-like [Andrographis paniculata]